MEDDFMPASRPRTFRVVEGRRRVLVQVAQRLAELDLQLLLQELAPYRRSGRRLVLGLRKVSRIETWVPELLERLIADVQVSGGQICFVVLPGSHVERALERMGASQSCPLCRSVQQGWELFWSTTAAAG